jgi:hypothetical protein
MYGDETKERTTFLTVSWCLHGLRTFRKLWLQPFHTELSFEYFHRNATAGNAITF